MPGELHRPTPSDTREVTGAARFYVPALGSMSLLGAWLLARVSRRQTLAAITTFAVVAALFGLGGWAFHDMCQFPYGQQLVLVHGQGGTVIGLEPGPGPGSAARPHRPAARADPVPTADHDHAHQPPAAPAAQEVPVPDVNESVTLTIRFPSTSGGYTRAGADPR